MGESTNLRATLRFDRRVRLEFRGATITSDAGLLACRELDDALGLTETANECLQESRGGRNVQHRLVGLLRQSVYSRLAGYEDTNDAERLADDPTMRVSRAGRRRGGCLRVRDRGPSVQPPPGTMSLVRRPQVLTQDGNVEGSPPLSEPLPHVGHSTLHARLCPARCRTRAGDLGHGTPLLGVVQVAWSESGRERIVQRSLPRSTLSITL